MKSGVTRVVWTRPLKGRAGPVRRNSPTESIPFLAVARSLGDVWSYCETTQEFVVSPDPDLAVRELTAEDACLVLASDGLTNVMAPLQVTMMVDEEEGLSKRAAETPEDDGLNREKHTNHSRVLVANSLRNWRNLRADNISAITPYHLVMKICIRNRSLSTFWFYNVYFTQVLNEPSPTKGAQDSNGHPISCSVDDYEGTDEEEPIKMDFSLTKMTKIKSPDVSLKTNKTTNSDSKAKMERRITRSIARAPNKMMTPSGTLDIKIRVEGAASPSYGMITRFLFLPLWLYFKLKFRFAITNHYYVQLFKVANNSSHMGSKWSLSKLDTIGTEVKMDGTINGEPPSKMRRIYGFMRRLVGFGLGGQQ
uniref:PPM-type phosphatase domain-containing protein n=1 Tax=Heterorhabditis bacteriophora TaxID=37862 RepID=A0A1I7X346_HETBA